MALYIISKGADINACDKNGRTALIVAIEQDNMGMFNVLMGRRWNIDLNIVAGEGYTALDLARQLRRGPMVKELQKCGARSAKS